MVKKRFIMSIGILCLCAVGINMRDSSKEIKQGNIQKTTRTIKKNNNEYKFPSKYTEYNGNVIFDTEIIVDSKSEKRIFYQGTAIQKKINFKPLRDEIFENSLETVEESTID